MHNLKKRVTTPSNSCIPSLLLLFSILPFLSRHLAMEKNTNTNANVNSSTAPQTSPDQRHGGERSPVTSPSLAHNVDINNPPPPATIVVIELSSSSDTPPPPPVVAPAADTGRHSSAATIDASVDVGTSYGGGSDIDQVKKRGRSDVNNPDQAVPKASKKKGELTEVPKGEPRCATCNKVFKSWKALFGHLRSHPERTYRGALPPPTAAELDIHRCQQQLASTLLTAAQAAASRRRLDIDLNQPSAADEEDRTGVGFDLNAEPPPESDDKD